MAGEKQAYAFSAVGNPENLHQMAEMTTPESTPVWTALGKTREEVKDLEYKWLTRSLRTAAANVVQAGAAITAADPALRAELSNYTQLSDNPYFLTDTQQAIAKKNGTNSDLGTIMQDAITELKRDINLRVITGATKVKQASGTAGAAAGLEWWFTVANNSNAIVQDAASKPLSETQNVMPALKSLYAVHDPKQLTLIVSPGNKNRVDTFSGGAMKQVDPKSGTLFNNIKMIRTSFGDMAVLVDRACPDDTAFIVDMSYLGKGFLQEFQDAPIVSASAKTAHSESRVVWCEWTLETQMVECGAKIDNIA